MKYKISNEPLKLREYGRNVQMMVNYCKTLESEHERNTLCREIIRIMSSMNPSTSSNSQDHAQKMWDHFFHLAEFDIDIDAEYPMPEPETMFSRPPERMPYNNVRSRFRQYGRNVELMTEEALRMEDEDRRNSLIALIANIMKMQIKSSEKDSNAELTVLEHLRVLSKGQIDLQQDEVHFHKFSSQQQHQHQHQSQSRQQGRKKNKKGNKGKYKRK